MVREYSLLEVILKDKVNLLDLKLNLHYVSDVVENFIKFKPFVLKVELIQFNLR